MDQTLIDDVTRALGYTENGGKPDLGNPQAGKTGETASVFQFEPGTWDNYSKQVFGQVVPMNADTETHVVQQKVGQWIQDDIKNGYSPEDAANRAASRWNAGAGEPDAYKGKFSDGSPSEGVNAKYGVNYSVPQYVGKFDTYMKQFASGSPSQDQADANSMASDQIANSELLDRGDKVQSQQGLMDWHQQNSPVPKQSIRSGLIAAARQKPGKNPGLISRTS